MDDLSEKLADLLNNPESMEQVRKMAESILGEETQKKETSPLDSIGEILGGGELQTIMSIMGKIKSAESDNRTQLLAALKPHLSVPRQEKVDTAIKILKVIEILPLIKESGII
jgi:hypothetical protein